MSSDQKISYSSYLQLDKLLEAQCLESARFGKPAHHELFFITVHQSYELWFKQIIFELTAVIQKIISADNNIQTLIIINAGLERINKIQGLLNEHLPVLETLNPTDFMTFRDLLTPASGFQSLQFRLIEIYLGLYDKKDINSCSFYHHFESEQQKQLEKAKNESSLFSSLISWLEHYKVDAIQFLKKYQNEVKKKLSTRQKKIAATQRNIAHDIQLEQLQALNKAFELVFDKSVYQNANRKLNYEHFLSALFLYINQHQPEYHQAYQVIKNIIELDELIATWRHRHALMVQRMIGVKVGTGGTSGYHYLLATVDKNRIFNELTELSGYLISDLYLDY